MNGFNRPRRAWIGAIGLGLLLLQIPFIATGHVQEDAFITFRCARNLVETGAYGFNPGERASASTSHAEVVVAAGLMRMFGEWFLPAVQVICGVATITGIYLLASALVAVDDRQRRLVWVLGCLVPVSILISYSGMETGLLILTLGAVLASTIEARFRPLGAAAWFLLPWIRPDALAFGAIALVAMAASSARHRPVGQTAGARRVAVAYASVALAGLVFWLAFNQAYFGVWLPQTISGKAVVFLPGNTRSVIVEGMARAGRIFFGDGYAPGIFVPIETKYLRWLSVPAFLLTLAAAAFSVARPASAGVRRPQAAALLVITFVVPLAYAAGGAPGTWYFWPSRLTGSILIAGLFAAVFTRQAAGVRKLLASAIAATLFVALAGQWCYAVAWSTQERLYRGGIGADIRRVSTPSDTLLLEPAGYVPYFAERRTWDEVGVASPLVTSYRRDYGRRWWIRFVQEKSPTFLLEREPMREFFTLDGYQLTREEREWFEQNYKLVRVFRYDARSLRPSPVLGGIASLGEAVNYLLYQRVSRIETAMNTNQAAKVP